MGALGSRGHEGSVKESVNSEGELPEPSAAPVTSWLGSPPLLCASVSPSVKGGCWHKTRLAGLSRR